MIPTIEQIIEDLLSGDVTKSQAVTWLHQHAQGYANELRDLYAGQAMQAILTGMETRGASTLFSDLAFQAYKTADAMLEARDK